MIGTPASKSFRGTRSFSRVSPLVWLNAVCLDAPLVAVSWHWLFARSFGTPVDPGGITALFLTAWLIYLADRFGDSISIDWQRATSFRQRFCLKHRRAWLITTALVATADVAVVATQLQTTMLMPGAIVGATAVVYLLTNQLRHAVWRVLPAKEIAIGVLFAAGTMVPIVSHLPTAALRPWVLFAALCTLNCISIAVWERWLDSAQRRVSIATAFPSAGAIVLPALLLLVVASSAIAWSDIATRSIYICVGASAALLGLTHASRRRIQPDVRTALADLVLLTPAVLLAWR